jgi:hypothetical protein
MAITPKTIRTDRVLAIDPGKATGLAWLRQDEGKIFLDNSFEAGPDEIIEMIRPSLADWKPVRDGQPPLRIVMERFTITAMTAQKSQDATWALETIGAVKQACRDAEYPLQAICWQKPAEAKTAFTNDKLKSLGLWHRGGEGHALDAIRHGTLYLAKVGWTVKNSV